jgi:hypothetical protein
MRRSPEVLCINCRACDELNTQKKEIVVANDQFHRAKSRNNGAVIMGLQRRGLSFIGAHQVVTGQIVTNPNDRRLVSVIAERHVGGGFIDTHEFELGVEK